MNILIVCEHASDKFGGEAMLPLNYFKLLSKTDNQVYLVTHERVRSRLDFLEGINKDNIHYLPDTPLHKLIFKTRKILPDRVYTRTFGALLHFVTQYYQRKTVKKLVRQLNIDVVHEPAPVSATQPSAMYDVGTSVLIGPLNGGMSFPDEFKDMSGKIEVIIYSLAKYLDNIFNRILPGKRKANLILVANERTKQALPSCIKAPVEILVENGSFGTAKQDSEYKNKEIINVLYVGRLVDWKCVDIAIEAVANLGSNVSVTIVGDGPDRKKLEALAEKNQLSNIQFTGLIPHKEVNNFYDNADIFILPSIRECGGAVVLEAMSRGLAVIATDWGGPADYITPSTGFLIAPQSREYMVTEFSNAIKTLAENPSLREKVGIAAIQRIEQHFLWNKKIEQIIAYYRQISRNIK